MSADALSWQCSLLQHKGCARFNKPCSCDCHGKRSETVKRVDLFGVVTDTYQTERELNGWRETQGKLI